MDDVFARQRTVTSLDQCDFYHTMEIPGYGIVRGQWDLRHGIREYLGGVDLRHKRVLEIGTASGFVCFWMESQGAEVIAYDLSPDQDWDIVPFARYDHAATAATRKEHIRRQNNAYWLCHRAFESKARVAYGTVYEVPPALGPVDVSTLCAVLLHVRDPFLALQRAAAITTETMIVTDRCQPSRRWQLINMAKGPVMRFLPNPKKLQPFETWWWLPEEIVVRFVGVLGFEDLSVTRHVQDSKWGKQKLYTIVARRTQGRVS